jgi:hypothetical protein
MATIGKIATKFRALNTDEVVTAAFRTSTDGFTEEQKKQLYAGFDKEGKRLQKYRNNKYARVKNEMNPGPGLGNPDLYVTGAYFGGIKTNVQGLSLHIESSDAKGPELETKYKPYGLGGGYKQEFIRGIYRPNFRKQVRLKTGV